MKVWVVLGKARQCIALHGGAWLGMAGLGEVRHGRAGSGQARLGAVRQGLRQGVNDHYDTFKCLCSLSARAGLA